MRAVLLVCVGYVASVLSSGALAQDDSGAWNKESRIMLSAYRGMVEEHVQGVLRALRVVAISDEAKSASVDGVKPLLTRLSDDLPTDSTAWFAYPDGRYFSTEVGRITEESLRERDYFAPLMSGKEVFGDLVISKSTGHRSVIVAVPVAINGRIVGAVGVSLRVRLLSELVDSRLPLPDNAYFYALERDTRIAIHRKVDRMFKTPSDVGDEALGEEFKKVLRQDRGTFDYTLHDKKMTSIFEFSPTLGWYFFIAKQVD